jgi:hypothetical protein
VRECQIWYKFSLGNDLKTQRKKKVSKLYEMKKEGCHVICLLHLRLLPNWYTTQMRKYNSKHEILRRSHQMRRRLMDEWEKKKEV